MSFIKMKIFIKYIHFNIKLISNINKYDMIYAEKNILMSELNEFIFYFIN